MGHTVYFYLLHPEQVGFEIIIIFPLGYHFLFVFLIVSTSGEFEFFAYYVHLYF